MDYSEEWKRKYKEDINANEKYWNRNPILRENRLVGTQRKWEAARDIGPLFERWKIAISNFFKKNESHAESWFQFRLKDSPPLPPATTKKVPDLFSDL